MTTKTPAPKKNYLKWIAIGAGGVIAVAHIGVLGHILRHDPRPQYPIISFPKGDYSSYRLKAGKDGYEIEYKANDPAILESERSLQSDQNKRGLFGGGDSKRREHRRDQYTMDGARNLGGGVDAEGKSAKEVECLIADAGARSQGAMAGSAIAAGVAVPAMMNIPYVGWLASGWALLLGQKVGSQIGSEVGSVFNDC